MKGVLEAAKAVFVTTAVYTWMTVAAVREVRHALVHKLREKYAQRPIDF